MTTSAYEYSWQPKLDSLNRLNNDESAIETAVEILSHLPDSIQPNYNQLLKWIGNKQRYAHIIADYFPKTYRAYYEPFLGSGGMLGVIRPSIGIVSDIFGPLIDIWTAVKYNPELVIRWYSERLALFEEDKDFYYQVRDRYNNNFHPGDLLFLTRSCYGGIIRFRKSDGYMSTPIGSHKMMAVKTFEKRVSEWSQILIGVEVAQMDYRESMERAKEGDIIYCDPPYNKTQKILYGSHEFSMQDLLCSIEKCKEKGVTVAVSIDTVSYIVAESGLFDSVVEIATGKQKLNNFHHDRESAERKEFLLISDGVKK